MRMMQRNPALRISAGEIWSVIDSLKDKIVKEKYTTIAVKLPEQRGMAKSATAV